MPKCPECGEPVQKGQTHCFACGSDFIRTPVKNRFLKGNTVFIAAIIGGCIIAVVLALFITRPKPKLIPTTLEAQLEPKPVKSSSLAAKPKESPVLSDVEQLELVLKELEAKVAKIDNRSQTGKFSKDETDALRFTKSSISEMKTLLESIKNTTKPEDRKRQIRQFRSKQNEAEQFLFILKKWL